jgi:hypothetical protein
MDEHAAKVKWSLYLQYGLKPFDNWLSLKRDQLKRDDIVAALDYETVKQYAKNTIEECRSRIAEIESMLAETSGVQLVESESNG